MECSVCLSQSAKISYTARQLETLICLTDCIGSPSAFYRTHDVTWDFGLLAKLRAVSL